jgi:hypothetical protein
LPLLFSFFSTAWIYLDAQQVPRNLLATQQANSNILSTAYDVVLVLSLRCMRRCLDALVTMGVLVPTGDKLAVRRTAQFFLNSFQVRVAMCRRQVKGEYFSAIGHIRLWWINCGWQAAHRESCSSPHTSFHLILFRRPFYAYWLLPAAPSGAPGAAGVLLTCQHQYVHTYIASPYHAYCA